jgi:hypothetical protein
MWRFPAADATGDYKNLMQFGIANPGRMGSEINYLWLL